MRAGGNGVSWRAHTQFGSHRGGEELFPPGGSAGKAGLWGTEITDESPRRAENSILSTAKTVPISVMLREKNTSELEVVRGGHCIYQ
jgi:hypothetical protein